MLINVWWPSNSEKLIAFCSSFCFTLNTIQILAFFFFFFFLVKQLAARSTSEIARDGICIKIHWTYLSDSSSFPSFGTLKTAKFTSDVYTNNKCHRFVFLTAIIVFWVFSTFEFSRSLDGGVLGTIIWFNNGMPVMIFFKLCGNWLEILWPQWLTWVNAWITIKA